MTPISKKMTKMRGGGVEARIGAKKEGREKDPEIQVETRIERKVIDAAIVMMLMADAIDRKKKGKKGSLKEMRMITTEEKENDRKSQTETVAGNVINAAKILVIVSRPAAVTIVIENTRRERKERKMAEMIETGPTTGKMTDQTGDARWGEMAAQTIGNMMRGGGNRSFHQRVFCSTLHTLFHCIDNTCSNAGVIKIRTILHQDEFKLSIDCGIGIVSTFLCYQFNKRSYLFFRFSNISVAEFSIA
jgi:hypothetical protein